MKSLQDCVSAWNSPVDQGQVETLVDQATEAACAAAAVGEDCVGVPCENNKLKEAVADALEAAGFTVEREWKWLDLSGWRSAAEVQEVEAEEAAQDPTPAAPDASATEAAPQPAAPAATAPSTVAQPAADMPAPADAPAQPAASATATDSTTTATPAPSTDATAAPATTDSPAPAAVPATDAAKAPAADASAPAPTPAQ